MTSGKGPTLPGRPLDDPTHNAERTGSMLATIPAADAEKRRLWQQAALEAVASIVHDQRELPLLVAWRVDASDREVTGQVPSMMFQAEDPDAAAREIVAAYAAWMGVDVVETRSAGATYTICQAIGEHMGVRVRVWDHVDHAPAGGARDGDA